MNLSKLKEVRLRNRFDKTLSSITDSRAVSQKEIRTVGILTIESISKIIDLQSRIEPILGVKNSKMYSFRSFNKTEVDPLSDFTKKDVSWNGDFKEPNFQSFLEQPFDLLIGYFNEPHLYLEMAVMQSKASFKVGFSGVNPKLYELEFLEKIGNTRPFSTELKKYLQILKKLKN
jgi:hypothetical protein